MTVIEPTGGGAQGAGWDAGLTLEEWLEQLADEESVSVATRSAREAAERIFKLQKHVKPDPEGWTVHNCIDCKRP